MHWTLRILPFIAFSNYSALNSFTFFVHNIFHLLLLAQGGEIENIFIIISPGPEIQTR